MRYPDYVSSRSLRLRQDVCFICQRVLIGGQQALDYDGWVVHHDCAMKRYMKEANMNDPDWKQELGKVGYEAYRAHTGGISLVSRKPIPPWGQLDQSIKDAWAAAADSIVAQYSKDINQEGM